MVIEIIRICTCIHPIWQPSIKIWKNEITKTTEYIHSLIERAISVQSTRNFFGKRWFKNSITNTALLKNPCIIKHSKNDVCIIAAGPSLNAHIENLKSIKIPTIAVSSTCCTLTENKIKPTFFISTDGGINWKNAVRGDGIATQYLTSGTISTNNITIQDGEFSAFRWDKRGINAYENDESGIHTGTFVRFD